LFAAVAWVDLIEFLDDIFVIYKTERNIDKKR
jgi:hypothetical protein